MLTVFFIAVILLFLAAYRYYGRFLERRFEADDSRPTPAHTEYDGVDWAPAPAPVLFGHHFSSIAGAGPVIGPILAALAFGWAPALAWILIGSIFIGGVHDYGALIASLRHGGRSLAQIARERMSPLAFRLMLLFIWLNLVYVLTVFADLTADTFVEDGSVATASLLFILLALGFGLCLYRWKVRLWTASLVFVPLVFGAVAVGHVLPLDLPEALSGAIGLNAKKIWSLTLLTYCLAASLLPVWLLLQPRDYLSSFLLYSSVAGGLLGILLGGFPVEFPAFRAWRDPQLGTLFPILFITIACGACSGFHALVSAGTTAKQLARERHAKPVGYGAMLTEGLVAVMALAAVMILPHAENPAKEPPLILYGRGMGRFLQVFGVPPAVGYGFGLLALSTFILTSLDSATRIGRYALDELFGWRGARARLASTLATLALPAGLVLANFHDAAGAPLPAWKVIWPVFGAANQLLAGLALLVLVVWLRRRAKPVGFLAGPGVFMLGMTLWALVLLVARYRLSLVGGIAACLCLLGVLLIVEAARTLHRAASAPEAGSR